MHHILKILLTLIFVAGIVLFYNLFVMYRPGATTKPTRGKLVGMCVVGVLIAGVCYLSQSLYATQQ